MKVPGVRQVVVTQTWEPGWSSNQLKNEGRRKLGLGMRKKDSTQEQTEETEKGEKISVSSVADQELGQFSDELVVNFTP